jgi:hypothetical protein
MGIRRRVTNWRKRADMIEGIGSHMPEPIQAEARGYVEAMRECADQLELTITKASQRETLT